MREIGLESVRIDAKKQYQIREKYSRKNLLQRKFKTTRPKAASDMTLLRKVDNSQPLLPCVIHGICRPTGVSGQIADTGSAVIHQMAVSLVHAVLSIFPGHIHNLIASAFNILIDCNILTAPSFGLILAG